MFKKDSNKFEGKINDLVDSYNFIGPLHFTDYSNLKSILSEGYLYSRNTCKESKIRFKDAAGKEGMDNSKIDIQYHTRFYYKEKTPISYRNEGIKINGEAPHIPNPVYLLFDSKIIYINAASYSDGDAVSHYTKIGTSYSFFNNMDWAAIFDRTLITEEIEEVEKWNIIRKRHAELLISIPVSLDYLRKIIFRSEVDLNRAIKDFGKDKRYILDPNMFNCNNNFVVYDKRIYNNEIKELSYEIKLNSEAINEYKYEFELFNDDLDYIECKYELEISNSDKLVLIKLKDYKSEWRIFNFYINGILSISEEIEKYNI